MAKITIEFDKEKKEVKMSMDGLNPLEIIKLLNFCITDTLNKIQAKPPEEKPKIFKPSNKAVTDINNHKNLNLN